MIGVTGASGIGIELNGDAAATNYYSDAIGGVSTNTNNIGIMAAGDLVGINIKIIPNDTFGGVVMIVQKSKFDPATSAEATTWSVTYALASDITSISLVESTAANPYFDIGSTLRVRELA